MFFIYSLGNHLKTLFLHKKRILTLCQHSAYKWNKGLEIRCSIQLSYGRNNFYNNRLQAIADSVKFFNYNFDYNQIAVYNIIVLIELFNSMVAVKNINHSKTQV